MGTIIERIYRSLRSQSPLIWIIAVNTGIFFLLRIAAAVMNLSSHPELQETMLGYVEMPSSIEDFAHRPWTAVTYMFCQFDALHIIMNMLILYWIGTLFAFTASNRRVLQLYIAGGLGGAAVFLIWFAIISPVSATYLIGSSASVFAIMTAAAIKMPRTRVRLMLIGDVQLRWVVLTILALDLIIGTGGDNFGGHLAHLGGVAVGAAFTLLPSVRSRNKKIASSLDSSSDDTATLDIILDKIRSSGYASLTADERRRLFEISSRIK
ncbi:MAG: rhomboid family intramembrane serine protease [Paramuribaculum sp.]|nr:rhomboid family intramembrane serine protease [Paramuribaculum sp.]